MSSGGVVEADKSNLQSIEFEKALVVKNKKRRNKELVLVYFSFFLPLIIKYDCYKNDMKYTRTLGTQSAQSEAQE